MRFPSFLPAALVPVPTLVLALVCAAAARAQPPDPRPFGTTRVSASAARFLDAGSPGGEWAADTGVQIEVESPFYWGVAQVGYQGARHTGSGRVPDFGTAFLYVGWGAEVSPLPRVHLLGAARAGIFRMDFEDTRLLGGGDEESELGFELLARGRVRVAGPVDAGLSVHYRPVLTNPLLEQTYVTLGLGVTFTNPDWVREFFD